MQANIGIETTEWLSVYDAIRCPMFVHDRQLRIRRANHSYAKLAGVKLSEILGQEYWKVFPKGAAPHNKVLRQSHHHYREYCEDLIHDERVYRTTNVPIRDKDGEYQYSVWLIEDITEKHQSQNQLCQMSRALRVLARTSELLLKNTLCGNRELPNLICEIATVECELAGSWIGLNPRRTNESELQVTGSHGFDIRDLKKLLFTPQGKLDEGCPATSALTTGLNALQQLEHSTLVGELQHFLWGQGVRSILAIPIRSTESPELLGVIVYLSRSSSFFSPDNIELLEGVARNYALADSIISLRQQQQHFTHCLEKSAREVRNSLLQLIKMLSKTIEYRDPYTYGHQARVASLARAIAEKMGLPQPEQEGIFLGAMIHDIGKIALPTEILSKPSKLSDTEFALIREHCSLGADIVAKTQTPWPLEEIISCHHEWINGQGYPKGLKGDEIPLCARIVTVADVVEAVATHRPYRPALGIKAGLYQIQTHSGTRFDPTVVDACLEVFKEGYRFPNTGTLV
ncbi:HD domain-containing phosphohydrolase [Dongshaea marina]|uniref:HD domain-containing phosphohydrolase n=1 Tax=Dongshaea marina TaxID=2047966 RepID=UPI000D3E9499|nr:HD domain-containing phosphohydrolase [Dongshaea marina]